MSCGRTKAASIITNVLAPLSVEKCIKELTTPMFPSTSDKYSYKPFYSVASDASNHCSTKLFPLAVRYWTPEVGLKSIVYDFYEDSEETAASIHLQIMNKLKENNLELERISSYTADNASVNYGKFNSVYQKLKIDNPGILKANCVAHIVHNCAKHASDSLDIDIECIVNKVFSHFSSSAKRTEQLKQMFEFVEEDYLSMVKHVPTRWLSIWPAVTRLHTCWQAIKAYFLSKGEQNCPKVLWKLLKNDQDSEGQPLKLQVYLSFLHNALKVFHDAILMLEGDNKTVCELYDIMSTLRTKLQQRQKDSFFGIETNTLLQTFSQYEATTIKEDFSNFYQCAIKYLEKWYDFSDNNLHKHLTDMCLKREFTFTQLCDVAERLQIQDRLDMDELYEEYCVSMPRQKEIVKRTDTVLEKWTALLKDSNTPNMTALGSFLFSIPITNAFVERLFSLMTAAWTDQRNRCSVDLIKYETYGGSEKEGPLCRPRCPAPVWAASLRTGPQQRAEGPPEGRADRRPKCQLHIRSVREGPARDVSLRSHAAPPPRAQLGFTRGRSRSELKLEMSRSPVALELETSRND
ncbi:hypothetical protein WMY93_033730 [Mugilogobius chulae]|uniref:HAT C-terminal dimerisation domain-containing protein n=1 Tax=Mugilogobius chulae TaxID=88201 RepID=A0AAW0MM12_9GOBI